MNPLSPTSVRRAGGWVAGMMLSTLVVGPLAGQTPSYNLAIEEHMFSNGLRLLVLERPGDHRVAAKIFTDFGALVEEPGMLGAAHFLEHLMFKGTTTLGTSNWEAERPIRERIMVVEGHLIEELNRARNELRERGVFHDYAHARTTPRADSLRAVIVSLEREASAYREGGAMMRWYQAYGGQRLTATTEQEYLKFDINLPAEWAEVFFRIESDRMVNTVFREFDAERMILVEQRYGDLNRPETPYYEQMNAAVGLVHPVFWPEGYLTDFDQYTRRYERNLYERYFVPNNTTIVMVGGVALEDMIPVVERYFGAIPSKPEPARVRAVEPIPVAERRVVYRSDEIAPRVEARFLIPGVGHPDRPAFDVVAEVVAVQLNSALRREDIGGSAGVNARVVHTARFGVPASLNVEVIAGTAETLGAAEGVLLRTLADIRLHGASDSLLAAVKRRLRNEWYRTALNPDQLAFEIGHFQVMDHWSTLESYLRGRESTTAEDVRRLATTYFIPSNRTIGVVWPETMAERDATEGTHE